MSKLNKTLNNCADEIEHLRKILVPTKQSHIIFMDEVKMSLQALATNIQIVQKIASDYDDTIQTIKQNKENVEDYYIFVNGSQQIKTLPATKQLSD